MRCAICDKVRENRTISYDDNGFSERNQDLCNKCYTQVFLASSDWEDDEEIIEKIIQQIIKGVSR